MVLRGQLQMLVLALHLALHSGFTPNFNYIKILVLDLILQSLLEVTTPLEDVTFND